LDNTATYEKTLARYNLTDDYWDFSTANTIRFTINPSGAIGFNNDYGVSGYLLKSAGNASPPVWSDTLPDLKVTNSVAKATIRGTSSSQFTGSSIVLLNGATANRRGVGFGSFIRDVDGSDSYFAIDGLDNTDSYEKTLARYDLTDNIWDFSTANTIRFTINAAGAVAFNASYGTSGHFLMSTGNASPPVWTAGGGGGSSGFSGFSGAAGPVGATLTTAFTSQTTVNVVHNFGTRPVVAVIDNTGAVIVPQSIVHNGVNDFTVTFSSSTTGNVISTAGGISGFSGSPGSPGPTGPSGGASGFSGFSGSIGTSGFSGYSGLGLSGFSGFSGLGSSGFSGFSGAGGNPGGSNTQVQYNNSGAFGGDAGLTYDATNDTLTVGTTGTTGKVAIVAATAEPSAAPADTGYLYARSVANRIVPKWIGPAGIDFPLQPFLGMNNIRLWRGGNTTTATTFASTVGTMPYTSASPTAPTIPTLTTTNLLTSTSRSTISTSATAGTLAYIRANQLSVWRGNAAGRGGFFVVIRFAVVGTLQSGLRAFAGLVDVAANPTNVNPLTNSTPGSIGMAIAANTGNWSLVHNITGTARTATDLGTNFAINNTHLLEIALFCPPNGGDVGWRVTNWSTGNQTNGTITTNLPATTTFLAPSIWITNNATAAAQQMDFISCYVETDY
jgi:hypothetical protein